MILTVARKFTMAFTVIAAMLFGAEAFASGSFSSAPTPTVDSPYDKGKRNFNRKVACKKCPLPGKKLDQEQAKAVIEALYTNEELLAKLDEQQRKDVVFYLAKRYKLDK
ncbi:hypothetical protein [Sessilibacter sp. MAH2]